MHTTQCGLHLLAVPLGITNVPVLSTSLHNLQELFFTLLVGCLFSNGFPWTHTSNIVGISMRKARRHFGQQRRNSIPCKLDPLGSIILPMCNSTMTSTSLWGLKKIFTKERVIRKPQINKWRKGNC